MCRAGAIRDKTIRGLKMGQDPDPRDGHQVRIEEGIEPHPGPACQLFLNTGTEKRKPANSRTGSRSQPSLWKFALLTFFCILEHGEAWLLGNNRTASSRAEEKVCKDPLSNKNIDASYCCQTQHAFAEKAPEVSEERREHDTACSPSFHEEPRRPRLIALPQRTTEDNPEVVASETTFEIKQDKGCETKGYFCLSTIEGRGGTGPCLGPVSWSSYH